MWNCFIFDLNLVIYYSIFKPKLRRIHLEFLDEWQRTKLLRMWAKKAAFWWVPRNKLKKLLLWVFKFEFKLFNQLIVKTNFHFFSELLLMVKSFSLITFHSWNLWLFHNLFFFVRYLNINKLTKLSNIYFFLFVLLIVSLVAWDLSITNISYSLFLNFFRIFFFWALKNFSFRFDIKLGEIFYLIFPKLFVISNTSRFIGNERFVKSHIFNFWLKAATFNFYLGYKRNFFLSNFLLSLDLTLYKSFFFISNFFESYWKGRQDCKLQNIWVKKNFLIFPLKKFLFSWWEFFIIFSRIRRSLKTGNFVPQFWTSLFFFLSNVKSFSFNFIWNFKFSKLIINFSLIFNKHLHLDALSGFLMNWYFGNTSKHNYKFFIWNVFRWIYPFVEKLFFLCFNLEFIFFTKSFIYRMNYWIFENLQIFFYSYIFITNNIWIAQSKKFFMLIKPKWWFEGGVFLEELTHLIREYVSDDIDWAREYVWIKQLAEVRLEWLTDYLKFMRLKKMDIGNVQYSPDFTQAHEFGLTLKWGFELEAIRWTRILILKRFHGTRKVLFKTNYINKKLEFLYNYWKIKLWTKIIVKETKIENLLLKSSDINLLWILKRKKKLELFSKWNFMEMTRLALSTLVGVNWDIHKYVYDQFDTFYLRFDITTEWMLMDVYNFVLLSFKRNFFLDTYNAYYSIKIVKWWISFSKMLKKKVFKTFMESRNFFNIVAGLYNSFNYSLFLNFRWLKKRITKVVKNKLFFTLVYSLIFKNQWSFFFPSDITKNDYQMYLYHQHSFFPLFSFKSFLINNYTNSKLKLCKMLHYREVFTSLLQNSNYLLNFYRFTSNSRFESFISTDLPNLFFTTNERFLALNTFKNYFDLEIFFLNFFSEFFYELYEDFLKNLSKTIRIGNFRMKNKFKQFNTYKNLLNKSFSLSFFYYLNSKSFKKYNCFWQNFIFFLNEFFSYSLKKKFLCDFSKRLKNYFFLNLDTRYDLNIKHLIFMNAVGMIVKNFLNNKRVRWHVILMFLYRLQKSSNIEDIDATLWSVFFNYNYMLAFSSNIEVFFIEFILKFAKEFFWI